jgi:hypothetical protein
MHHGLTDGDDIPILFWENSILGRERRVAAMNGNADQLL